MDPNANLNEQERIVIISVRNRSMEQKRRLKELREALNVWIARGGFEPDWAMAPLASRYFGE